MHNIYIDICNMHYMYYDWVHVHVDGPSPVVGHDLDRR